MVSYLTVKKTSYVYKESLRKNQEGFLGDFQIENSKKPSWFDSECLLPFRGTL